jgi:hypothetical protein
MLAQRAGASTRSEGDAAALGPPLGGLIAAAYAAGVAGLVLVDATPPPAGVDRAVATRFAVAGVLASALRVASRLGATQLLLPGYSGQRQLPARLSPAEYRASRSAVACSFRNGAAELRAVPAGARAVAPLLRPAHGRPLFGDRPVGVVSSAAYGPRWDAWQAQWAAISRRSVHGRTGDRFHDIHLRHPDRVLDAVR